MKIEITEKNKDIESLKIEDNLNLCLMQNLFMYYVL